MSLNINRVATNVNAAVPSATDLFLEIMAPDILITFATECVTNGRTLLRTIPYGDSELFPTVGTAKASWHAVGGSIRTSSGANGKVKHSQKKIYVDDTIIGHDYLHYRDLMQMHYDVRSHHAREIALSLARARDQHVLATGIAAARTSGDALGTKRDGNIVTKSDAASDGEAFIACLYEAARKFREKDVNPLGLDCYVTPAMYELVAQTGKVISMDLGGSGSVASGMVPRVAGFNLVITNQLGVVDEVIDESDGSSDQSGVKNDPFGTGAGYAGSFDTTAALIMAPGAVGTVQLHSIEMEAEWLIEDQTTLVLAKYAAGHGVLRPECACEIRTGTPS